MPGHTGEGQRLFNLRGDKGRYLSWLIVIMAVAAGALILLEPFFEGGGSATPLSPVRSEEGAGLGYQGQLAADLERVLESIQGAGQVEVFLYFDSGPKHLYAEDEVVEERQIVERDSQGGTRETTETRRENRIVTVDKDGERQALVVESTMPRLAGVLVVAEGAVDPETRALLARAVQTALRLPAHRVMVVPRKGGG